MWVYPDFFAYRSGIYRHSRFGAENKKGFHSVRLIGWGEERFGFQTTKYWVCKSFLNLSNNFSTKFNSFSSLPTRGVVGGAKADTSRSCAVSTSAASRITFSRHSPIFTMASRTVGRWSAPAEEPLKTHKLIKCPKWYPVVQCNFSQTCSFIFPTFERQPSASPEDETNLPRFTCFRRRLKSLKQNKCYPNQKFFLSLQNYLDLALSSLVLTLSMFRRQCRG